MRPIWWYELLLVWAMLLLSWREREAADRTRHNTIAVAAAIVSILQKGERFSEGKLRVMVARKLMVTNIPEWTEALRLVSSSGVLDRSKGTLLHIASPEQVNIFIKMLQKMSGRVGVGMKQPESGLKR